MHKIAIISDIHGNLPALKAVLEDIKNEYKTDKIYCLGDLVDAVPWHNEVIELIRELQIPTIMGNHDERIALDSKIIAMPHHSASETEARINAINYTKQTITENNRNFLAQLMPTITLEIGDLKCLLVHGSPESNKRYIFENHDEESVKEMFRESGADIIINGHTHLSYIRSVGVDEKNKMFVNAGSVGRSKEQIGGQAVYLWLNIDTSGETTIATPVLRKINYNIEETIKGIEESPISNFYADFFLKHLNRV